MIGMATALIKHHEGFVPGVYVCPAGYLTFGYGRNLESNGLSDGEVHFALSNLSDPEGIAIRLLENDLSEVVADLETFVWWHDLDKNRQAAVVDFRYNVGAGTFRAFVKFIAAMEKKDYVTASDELFLSKWFNQVKRRGSNIRSIVRTGEMIEIIQEG